MMWIRKIYYIFRRHKPQEYKPVIVITGCASGIGLAIATLLYNSTKYRVVVTAREKSLHKLTKRFVENENFWILPLDVTHDPSRQQLFQKIRERWQGVNILINNAGISYRAVVEDMSEKDELLQMSTNYLGPMALIRLALPYMREMGRGKIISVSSVSGMLAMPTMSAYSASKYALEGACEALWYEARPFGIDVSLVQPGFIHSSSFKNVYYTEKSKESCQQTGPYCDYYKNMTPFVGKMMDLSFSTPEKIAKLILRVIQQENPPLWIPATFDAKFFYYLRRILPRRILLPFLFFCLPNAKSWGKDHTHKRAH